MRPFEFMSSLQYRVKALKQQVEQFKSGEAYKNLEAKYEDIIRQLKQKEKQLEAELAKAHSEIVTVRKIWSEVMDNLEKEYKKVIAAKERLIKQLKARILELEVQRDKAKEEVRNKQLKIYEVETALEEEREKNRKLTAQVNRDFENSSIPSSMQGPGRKKVHNTRTKTDRKPGGQVGHKGNRRKVHTPTESHALADPAEYKDNPDYYETGKVIRKQKVVIRMTVQVIEYTAKEYRNRKTGRRVHATFPAGYVNEVNYDGTVKAFAFLLGNECCVSHDKIRKLISELTNGEVELSKGMINGLCKEFSAKTQPEKKEILNKLMTSPVMNADFTNASVNGKSAQVLVLASPETNVALYIARAKKGHEGVKGTPLEGYVGTVVHDHDKTFYRYGTNHQECTQHDCRYLVSSEENEPTLTWNHDMHDLFREMLHYRNGLDEQQDLEPSRVAEFEARYDEILEKARKEYEYEPPSDYYRDGYNLYVRLKDYKENELLFLHDKRVPANNSLCERLARVYKRKQKQAMALRSLESLGYICDGLSTVYLLRTKDGSLYQEISDIFDRSIPVKSNVNTGSAV